MHTGVVYSSFLCDLTADFAVPFCNGLLNASRTSSSYRSWAQQQQRGLVRSLSTFHHGVLIFAPPASRLANPGRARDQQVFTLGLHTQRVSGYGDLCSNYISKEP